MRSTTASKSPWRAAAGHAEAAGAERRAVAAREVRVVEHRDRHRVDRVPDRDALALHEGSATAGVEASPSGRGRRRGSSVDSGMQSPPQVPDSGQRVEDAVRRRDAQDLAAVPAVRHAVPVGDDRALGERRRARGVEDGERIVGTTAPRAPRERGVQLGRSPASSTSEGGGSRGRDRRRRRSRGGAAGSPAPRARPARRRAAPGSTSPSVSRKSTGPEVIGQEQRGRVRLAEDVAQLVRLVARVERHHHRADERAGVLGEEPRRPVGQPERDLVVLADAEREERARDAPRPRELR